MKPTQSQSEIPKPNSLSTQSELSPSPWLNCPVCHDTRRITSLSKDMAKALRRLRRDLKACASCSIDVEDCPIRQSLNAQIQVAIQTVVDHWNLTPP
jgi:hypothetical protein